MSTDDTPACIAVLCLQADCTRPPTVGGLDPRGVPWWSCAEHADLMAAITGAVWST